MMIVADLENDWHKSLGSFTITSKYTININHVMILIHTHIYFYIHILTIKENVSSGLNEIPKFKSKVPI